MINVTTWSPDTCGCVIAYSWDRDVSPLVRVHTWSRTDKTCPEHISFSEAALYTRVTEENQLKNQAISVSIEVLGGEVTHRNSSWSFSDDRSLLTIEFPELILKPQDRIQIQNALDVRFGPAKVLLT